MINYHSSLAGGQEFIKKGKTCVLSDYNKYCVGYISEHILLWEKD